MSFSGSKDQGFIYRWADKHVLDCYVAAEFTVYMKEIHPWDQLGWSHEMDTSSQSAVVLSYANLNYNQQFPWTQVKRNMEHSVKQWEPSLQWEKNWLKWFETVDVVNAQIRYPFENRRKNFHFQQFFTKTTLQPWALQTTRR